MKSLMNNYFKMIKGGLFHKPFIFILILIIPYVLSLYYINSKYASVSFLIFGGISVAAFLPGMVFNDISEKKYILFSTIPVKIKDTVKIMYLHTYIIYLSSFMVILLISRFSYNQYVMMYLALISICLILSNIFFPYFSSNELKLGINQQEKVIVLTILYILCVGFGGIVFVFILPLIKSEIVFNIELTTIIISIIAAVGTIKISYNTTMKKIMGY